MNYQTKIKIQSASAMLLIFLGILCIGFFAIMIERTLHPINVENKIDTIYIEKLPDSLVMRITELERVQDNLIEATVHTKKLIDITDKDLMDFFD